ncbi:amylo-alpha-1,6-glucosidase [Agromyces tardus]|jgi:glycogen debranching enzyme|uniref:Amylo-alpha-1,6-glucosidase n=1 Tax=Agromyces tardus TaxID=2583849 RepID=A0A3M7ZYJ8_9MICO|nr:glycogen debranching N-terminal domain-containing protein [Agromyces tardus]RNB44080.1 amylo-alpha-1,6-glucosidase [Agromyces tardus]
MTGWNADNLARSPGGDAITIVEGSSFCISGANGDIVPELPHGVFFRDTRLVSRWTLLIDGTPVEPLSSMTPEPFRAIIVGRAAHVPGRADTPLIVERDRRVGAGLREDVRLHNYGLVPLRCRVEMVLESDFADIFEVKDGRAGSSVRAARQIGPGRMRVTPDDPGRLALTVASPHAAIADHRLGFDVELEPHGSWSQHFDVLPTEDEQELSHGFHDEGLLTSEPARRLQTWNAGLLTASVGDAEVEEVLEQSQRDLGALRIFDARHPERAVIAAGVPWFMALFGRDSLLTSYMALPLDPSLALGTLRTLAELQGVREVASSEEQPGRILHEVRLGATTNLALGGTSVYYGTADATALFVVVLGELARWGALPDDATDLLEAADRALAWVEGDGDRDGDGFVEYARLNDHGLVNQGWKDSWDGINFADGTIATPPIALCEVQGYVYAAYVARAMLAEHLGDSETAQRCTARAEALKREFNERFWMPERGYFAIALDRDKRQVDACASNMGHCLWSGIVDDDKAAQVADRLLSDEMFTGWGVRTLAADMGAYNPASYHNGSVWPHDNAIVAAGLMRYGFVEHAQRIAVGLFDAASRFDSRLPELFCGFDRRQYPEPVAYPASCSPQAWAAAAPFSLLRTLLRLDPSATTGEMRIDPALPAAFGELRLDHVPFAGSRLSIAVSGDGTSVTGLPADLTLLHGADTSTPEPTRRGAP